MFSKSGKGIEHNPLCEFYKGQHKKNPEYEMQNRHTEAVKGKNNQPGNEELKF